MLPLVGTASWFSVLPAESRSTDLHYNTGSKLHHLPMNCAPPPPFFLYHIISEVVVVVVGGGGGSVVVVMVVRGDVEHSRLSPN